MASAAVIKHDWIVKQQNAVLHGLLVLLARQSSNTARSNAPTQSCMGSFLRLSVTAAKQQRSLARAPCFACQATQQRSRTQSCTGAFLRLPGTAATQLAKARAPFCACQSRQQSSNAVLHGLLFALARQGSNAAERSLARAPCFACQAKQQRSRTQSCTGSFLRLAGRAATQQRSLARAPCSACQAKQQGSLFCLPGEAATHLASTAVIQHDGHPARRSSSTTARYGANPGRLGGTPCWGIVHWDSNPSVSVFVSAHKQV